MNATNDRYVVDYGGNGEVVVLLHGFMGSSGYWKKLRPLLGRVGYRVITIDLLGFGKAPKPAELEYSYDDHMEHIHQALTRMGVTEPFILVGHSLGALLAARYGRRYGARVKSLILLHPPLYNDRAQARATLRATGAWYRTLLDSRGRHYLWIVLRNIGPIGKHTRYSREGSLANVIERAEMFDDLRTTHKETLLLVGTKDRAEYLANLSQHEINPMVQVMVANVGHHSPRLRPNFVFGRIAAFLLPG